MVSAPAKKIKSIAHVERLDVDVRQLEKQRDQLLQAIHNHQAQVFQLNAQIADLKDKWAKRTLFVTPHAIERFKQRIVSMPDKAIRKLLSSPELTEAYQKTGPGKYSIKDIPQAIVVIKDFTVVTVTNKYNYETRLALLPLYMEYFVDQKISRALGQDVYLMSFGQWRKVYWRGALTPVP